MTAQKLTVTIGPGILDLLLKAAAHPSTDVSGIALGALTEEVSSETGLVHKLLPILQGRAIAPHCFDGKQVPSLRMENQSEFGVFDSFDHFRTTSLADCLDACFKAMPEMYMTSCVAAIEEFCQPDASPQVSFHLEAALFCIGIVSEAAVHHDMTEYLMECTGALARRGPSLDTNPLTLAQACRFIAKVRFWRMHTVQRKLFCNVLTKGIVGGFVSTIVLKLVRGHTRRTERCSRNYPVHFQSLWYRIRCLTGVSRNET